MFAGGVWKEILQRVAPAGTVRNGKPRAGLPAPQCRPGAAGPDSQGKALEALAAPGRLFLAGALVQRAAGRCPAPSLGRGRETAATILARHGILDSSDPSRAWRGPAGF